MKSGMQTYFFFTSYAFRSKVSVLVIVGKIRDPEKINPGSGSRGKKLQIQGVKSSGSKG
jgi:hypothetical protein